MDYDYRVQSLYGIWGVPAENGTGVTKVAAGSIYRAAAEAVNTLTSLDISHQTVGRMVRTVGQKYAHSGSVSCERENPSASWLCQKEGPD